MHDILKVRVKKPQLMSQVDDWLLVYHFCLLCCVPFACPFPPLGVFGGIGSENSLKLALKTPNSLPSVPNDEVLITASESVAMSFMTYIAPVPVPVHT